MATWIRNGTGTAPTGGGAVALTGSYALDNATAPADFDPTAVTEVRTEWTITGSGFSDDSWANDVSVALVTSGAVELATGPGSGATGLQNESDSSVGVLSAGIPTGQTVAAWESAFVRGNGIVIPDEWVTVSKSKGWDASTLTASAVTVTITYTAGASTTSGTATSNASGSTGTAVGSATASTTSGTAVSNASGSTGTAVGTPVAVTVNGTATSNASGSTGTAVGAVVVPTVNGTAVSNASGSTGTATGTPSAATVNGTAVSNASGSTGTATGTPSAATVNGTAVSNASGSTGTAVGTPVGVIVNGTAVSNASGSTGTAVGTSAVPGANDADFVTEAQTNALVTSVAANASTSLVYLDIGATAGAARTAGSSYQYWIADNGVTPTNAIEGDLIYNRSV